MLEFVFRGRAAKFPRACLVVACSLGTLIWLTAPASAQATKGKAAPVKPSSTNDDDDEAAKKAPPGVQKPATKGGEPVAGDDTAQSRKIVPNEIFRDPMAEKLLDLADFKPVIRPRVTPAEVNQFKGSTQDPTVDRALMDRVVDAMAAQLSDHANIQALIDPATKANPNSTTIKAIDDATRTLLEPIFSARGYGNQNFLLQYARTLKQKLEPLLKNHLIPRIQAMIVLGECGSVDLLPLYQEQLKNPEQTVWVKLWAMEGMSNIIGNGGRLNSQQQVAAAKAVADFLANDEIPWPAQLRGLEVLSAMREGFEPTKRDQVAMAAAAMRLLTEADAKPEVRSEAARALGGMKMSSVAKYNYALVAHSIGMLAADLGTEIPALLPDSPKKATTTSARAPDDAPKTPKKADTTAGKTAKSKGIVIPDPLSPPPPPARPVKKSINPAKAKYLTALLIGPVYEAFDGMPSQGDSGLLRASAGESGPFIQKVFDLVKPIAKTSVDLLNTGARQIDDKKKELAGQVTALREFLDQNPPTDRHIVPNGATFPAEGNEAPAADDEAPAPKSRRTPPARKIGRRAQ
jgi:hypothetical protein